MTGYLSLGSNLGNRIKNLEQALKLLEEHSVIIDERSSTLSGNQSSLNMNQPELRITKKSAIYETEPWGGVEQASFYNMAVEFESVMGPQDLLKHCQRIEECLGRERKIRWGPRVIDIDILTYYNYVINTKELTLPHPYMEQREFVLAPLREIEPDLILPSGKSIQMLKGEGKVQKLSFT